MQSRFFSVISVPLWFHKSKLAHDKPVPSEHSQLFFDALRAEGVPAHYLELPSGGHGLNGYQGPMWDAWQAKSLAWLEEMKLTGKP